MLLITALVLSWYISKSLSVPNLTFLLSGKSKFVPSKVRLDSTLATLAELKVNNPLFVLPDIWVAGKDDNTKSADDPDHAINLLVSFNPRPDVSIREISSKLSSCACTLVPITNPKEEGVTFEFNKVEIEVNPVPPFPTGKVPVTSVVRLIAFLVISCPLKVI